jgi:hypothetical protein
LNKENIESWRPVLTRFNDIFHNLESFNVNKGEEVKLAIPTSTALWPKELILQILHFTKVLLESCADKSSIDVTKVSTVACDIVLTIFHP